MGDIKSAIVTNMSKLLLIDDDRAFTNFLSGYIRDNYPLLQVEICNNPIAALQRIKAGGYDLLLIDLEMPSMDGIKLLGFATQTGIDKNRIVILSGRDANFLHKLCPMGSCLAVLNKFEARQKAVLDMIFSSLEKKPLQNRFRLYQGGVMIKRIAYLVMAAFTALTLSGCLVAESKYLKKVEDADNLSKALAELTEKHNKTDR